MIDMGTPDDSRVAPSDVVVNSLFFLTVFDSGGSRTESRKRSWLAAPGFKNMERFPWDSGLSLMVDEKA